MSENDIELEKNPVATETAPETTAELEPHLAEAIRILEKPKDGSFILGLQVFVAWANLLLADDEEK